MEKRNGPVVDQKIVPEKSSKGWLWILLALIIIALLAWWWLSNRNHDNTMQTSDTSATPAVVADNTAASDATAAASDTMANTGQMAAADANQPTIVQQLQTYYADNSLTTSGNYDLNFIDFASGSATPQVNDTDTMNQVVAMLTSHPNSKVVLHGYADATGPDSLNDPLSAQRAQAVKKLLVDNNINANRISIAGEGDAHPVATNENPTGRSINRRVTLHVTGK